MRYPPAAGPPPPFCDLSSTCPCLTNLSACNKQKNKGPRKTRVKEDIKGVGTFRRLPSASEPFSPWIACCAVMGLSNDTNPKPLLIPVVLSFIITADTLRQKICHKKHQRYSFFTYFWRESEGAGVCVCACACARSLKWGASYRQSRKEGSQDWLNYTSKRVAVLVAHRLC